MTKDNTFLRITNRDIFDKIENIAKSLESSIKTNDEGHAAIVKHIAQTNGKVKLNKWIATTALTIGLTLFAIFIKFS